MGWFHLVARSLDELMNKLEIKNTLLLGSIFGLRMFGLFMVLPIFSLLAIHIPHSNPTLIGIALGIYGLTQALFQLPFGIWSDFIPRKQVIIFGLIIFIIGSIIAAVSNNIYLLILGRALQGMGAIGSAVIALLGDLVRSEYRTPAVAIMGITIGISFVLAVMLGPLLAHHLGLKGMFWLTAILATMSFILVSVFLPSIQPTAENFSWQKLKAQLLTVLFHRDLMLFNFSIFMAHALLTATFFALPNLLWFHYGIPLNQQWKAYAILFLLAILFIGKKMRQKNFRQEEKNWVKINVFLLWIAQIFLFLSVFKFSYSLIILYIGLYLFLQSFTFLEALLPSLVSKTISMDLRGSATGLFSTCQFLGIFAGGLWSGVLVSHFHLSGLFLANILLGLLWLLVMLT